MDNIYVLWKIKSLQENLGENEVSSIMVVICDIVSDIDEKIRKNKLSYDYYVHLIKNLIEIFRYIRDNREDECLNFEEISNNVKLLFGLCYKLIRIENEWIYDCDVYRKTAGEEYYSLLKLVMMMFCRHEKIFLSMLHHDTRHKNPYKTIKISSKLYCPIAVSYELEDFSKESLVYTNDLKQLESMADDCPICLGPPSKYFAIYQNCRHNVCLRCAEKQFSQKQRASLRNR